ncbi:M48 family metallopeptidase [Candidatus Babela massiliensis]|uniref:Zn-dependent protease with chaperone function n=1 Tax=Candidatus Babela massiliensis TaxID=673862 RepID=V6DHY8_9BACT|nr:M48 family metallopeptidase [Candidatus Babela massiliensis]CDK30146.1 Zn-dependent protease with chaperone function [Candidatus Babela massiliensis]
MVEINKINKITNKVIISLIILGINFNLSSGFFSCIDKIKNTSSNLVSKIFNFGQEKLDEKNEDFIKGMINRFKMNNFNINIFKMNNHSLQKFGQNNAFVSFSNAYFSKSFLDKLSQDQKEFLIAHELMHIKNQHTLKMIAVTSGCALTTGLLSYYISKYIDKNYLKTYKNKLPKKFQNLLSSNLVLSPGLLAMSAFTLTCYSRFNEKQADRDAALNLGDIKGGVKLLELFKSNHNKPSNRLFNYVNSWFGTHPSSNERIELLKKLKINT